MGLKEEISRAVSRSLVIFSSFIGVVIIVHYLGKMRYDTISTARIQLTQVHHAFDLLLGERIGDVKTIGQNPALASYPLDVSALQAILISYRNNYKIYSAISIIDQDGKVIVDANRIGLNEIYTSQLPLEWKSGSALLEYKPAKDGKGDIVLVSGVGTGPKYLHFVVLRMPSYHLMTPFSGSQSLAGLEGAEIDVIDRREKIDTSLVTGLPSEILTREQFPPNLDHEILSSSYQSILMASRSAGSARYSGHPWVVVLKIPILPMLKDLLLSLGVLAILLFLVFRLQSLVARRIADNVANPVVNLLKNVVAIQQGRYEALTTNSHYNNEFGELSHSIWMLASSLESHESELIKREKAIAAAVAATAAAELRLERTELLAGLGFWDLDLLSGQGNWSGGHRAIFSLPTNHPAPTFDLFMGFVYPEDRQPVQELFTRILEEKLPEFRFEFRILLAQTSEIRWIENYTELTLADDGRPIKMSGYVRDITEAKASQETIRAGELLMINSAKMASLGQMAAGVAHEINNPLAIIAGSARLLSKYSGNPEKQAEKIASITGSCERIGTIVNGLKKFARTDEQESPYVPVLLAKIAQESVVLLDWKSKTTGIPVTLNITSEACINCNEVEIEQVLINLIGNGIDAIKSTPDGWVKVSVFDRDQYAVLRVEDSGPGIPENIRTKIFQPFFSTKPNGEGTGLGLSIAKGIIDAHEAAISILTQHPNTCFELCFSLAIRSQNVKSA